VLFSPVTIERDDAVVERGVGLGPLAVLPVRQKTGVGSALARAGLDACRQLGHPWCVVLGDPAYYGRFGFSRALDAGVANQFGARDAFMIIALEADRVAPLPAGMARYGAEFHT
jgi:putative acetyltransferase